MAWTEKPAGPVFFVVAPTLLMLGVVLVLFGGDDAAAEALRAFRRSTPALSALLQVLTDYGGIPFHAAYAFILVRALRTGDREAERFVGFYLASLVLTLFTVYCLKVVVSRPRPFIDYDNDGLISFDRKLHSFPSNHMSEALAATLPFALRRRAVPVAAALGLYNAFAAFARLYLGAHHATDILGSVVLGCLVTWAFAAAAGSPNGRAVFLRKFWKYS